jgi:type II secretory pathway predicted ATPase ExeA
MTDAVSDLLPLWPRQEPAPQLKSRRVQCLQAQDIGRTANLAANDAHDLRAKTLVGLKRLIEVVRDGNGTLSVVLAGHPKLKNDMRRPTMEEIGSRAAIFDLEGLGGDKQSYLKWLLAQCLSPKGKAETADKIEAVLTDEALAFLSGKLSTPLQFETYLTRSFEEGYRVGQKPVTVEVMESILARDINELEPRLTRNGYNAKILSEVLNAKPREIRALLRGQLAPGRALELQHEMLAVGIPL